MDWRAALHDDVVRNGSIGRVTVVLFRLNQLTRLSQLRRGPKRYLALLLLMPLIRVCKYVWVDLLMGAELPRELDCGPGLRLPHGGRGVIVHRSTRLGRDVTLFQGVNLGISEAFDADGVAIPDLGDGPVLGDGVYVGRGASVFGPVKIGARSRIGAMAVVLDDVEADTTVVGIPARPLGDARRSRG
ncbi:MAG: serine acetyltransferase [Acidimicrobiia bacterium]